MYNGVTAGISNTSTGTVTVGPTVETVAGSASEGFTYTGSSLSVSGYALGTPTPQQHNAIAFNVDPGSALQGSGTLTGGTVYLAAVYGPKWTTTSTIHWGVSTVGATPTANENWVGLFNSAGTLLASTDVDSNITSTGHVATTITTQTLSPGLYWVGWVFNAATVPKLYAGNNAAAATLVNGTSPERAAIMRAGTNGTIQTALSASRRRAIGIRCPSGRAL